MTTATTAEQRVPQLRHDGVQRAVRLLVAGDRDTALAVLLDSVWMQARLSGIRCDL